MTDETDWKAEYGKLLEACGHLQATIRVLLATKAPPRADPVRIVARIEESLRKVGNDEPVEWE